MLRAEGGNKCAGRLCPAHWPPAARGHGDSGDSGLTAGLQSTVSTAAACLLSGGHWGLHPTLLGNKSIFYVLRAPGIYVSKEIKSKFSLHDKRQQLISQFSSCYSE